MEPLDSVVVIAERWDKPQAANVEEYKVMPVYGV
jgi:hypothetical protein